MDARYSMFNTIGNGQFNVQAPPINPVDARNSRFNAIGHDQINIQTANINSRSVPEPHQYVEGASWNPDLVCLEGTRTSLLGEIMQLIEAPDSSKRGKGICVVDVPGSGKTAIAHSVSKHCAIKGILASSFFFDRETDGRSNLDRFLGNLTRDFASFHNGFARSIDEVLQREHTLPYAPPSRRFERLIVGPALQHPIDGPVVIVIDGLDECCDSTGEIDTTLVRILRDQIQKLPSNYRFVVTSRPKNELDMLFGAQDSPFRLRTIDILSESNIADIVVYARHRLTEMSHLVDTTRTWPTDELLEDFARKAEGLFAWACTVCNYLRTRIYPDKELEKLLSERTQSYFTAGIRVDGEMGQLYAKILSGCNWDDENFVEGYGLVMGTIVAAKTPLSSSALQSLHHSSSMLRVFNVLRPLKTLVTSVDNPQQPMRLVHLSLRDFLTTRARHSSTTERYSLDEKEHSQRLGRLCVEIINRDLKATMPGLGYTTRYIADWSKMPEISDGVVSEELWYACRFWIDHLVDIDNPESDTKLTTELLELISTRIVPWMELVAAKGEYRKYEKVRNWIQAKFSHGHAITRASFKASVSHSLVKLSRLLAEQGRRQEGLDALEEGVSLMRRIAKLPEDSGSNDFDPSHLAVCLTTLASRLHDVHRLEEAIEVAQEGVKLHRQIMEESPKESGNSLPAALSNLSIYLSEVTGREEEALEVVQEAVMITRGLPVADRTEILAQVLATHASRLSELGRGAEATEVIQEAIDLNRHQQSDDPNEYTPKLAASLSSYSHRLSESGDIAQAIEAAQESTDLFRQLARDQPVEFNRYLAGSLNNLGTQLSKLDRDAEALVPFEEALNLHRQLAAESPEAFDPSLARSLHNFSVCLAEVGRHGESWVTTQEAVHMFRILAADRPASFNDDLALALRLSARCLQHLDRREEALSAVQESVEIWRKLAEENPTAWSKGLISSLLLLQECLEQLGHEAESFRVKIEVVNMIQSDQKLGSREPISQEMMRKAMEAAAEEMEKKYGTDASDAVRAARQALDELKDRPGSVSTADLMGEIEKKLGIDPEAMKSFMASGGSSRPQASPADFSTSDPVDRRLLEAALRKFEQDHGTDSGGLLDLIRQTMDESGGGASMSLDSLFDAVAHKAGVGRFTNRSSAGGSQRSRAKPPSNAPSTSGSSTQVPPIIEVTDFDCADIFADARHDMSAIYLTNLSTELSGSGHHQEAVAAIQEAVTINRRLAEDQPAAFNPDLATSLHMLSSRLLTLDRQEEALKSIQEAIAIRRKLAADHPQIFRTSLEESLRVLNQCRLIAERKRSRSRSRSPARDTHRDDPLPVMALIRAPAATARIVEVTEIAVQTDEPDNFPGSRAEPTIETPAITQSLPHPSNDLVRHKEALGSHQQDHQGLLSAAGISIAQDEDALSDLSDQTSRRASRTDGGSKFAMPEDERPITIDIIAPAEPDDIDIEKRHGPITADNLHHLCSEASSEADSMHERHAPQMATEELSARMTGYTHPNTTPSYQDHGLKELRSSQAEMHIALLKSIENQEKLLEMMVEGTSAAGAGVHQASGAHSIVVTEARQYHGFPSDVEVYRYLVVVYLATLVALLVACLLPLGLLFYRL